MSWFNRRVFGWLPWAGITLDEQWRRKSPEKWKHPCGPHGCWVRWKRNPGFLSAWLAVHPCFSEAVVLVGLLSPRMWMHLSWEELGRFSCKNWLDGAIFSAALEPALLRSCPHPSVWGLIYAKSRFPLPSLWDVPFSSTFNHLVSGHILSPHKMSVNQGNSADSHLAD